MSGQGLVIDAAAWASPWRRRRVRDKGFLSLGLLSCTIVLPPWPAGVATGVVAVVTLLGPAQVRPALLGRSLRIPLTVVVLGAATVLVSIGGSDEFVSITAESARMAGTALVRGFAGTLSMFVLAATTPMVDLLAAMRRLRIPGPLIDIAGLMYRLVFVLLGSVTAITTAQIARLGYSSRRNALRSSAAATSAVFLRTWQRASRLESGLAGRGFTDTLHTVDPPPRTSSTRFLLVSALTLGALAALGIVGR